jgi:hypothetical protein
VSAPPRIGYAADLVEAAVLLRERVLARAEAARFRAERDRVYECEDADEREARFEELHGRFFVQLGLDRPLHAALGEFPQVLRRVGLCQVLRAIGRRDEGADLRDELARGMRADRSPPALVVRLRPESLLEPSQLAPFLRRELQQVADMLDPAFGYERELPVDGADPARASLLRERYRVVWVATVEGRLAARQGCEPEGLEACRSAFSSAFPAPEDGGERAFERWFHEPAPTHRAILAFIGAGQRPD